MLSLIILDWYASHEEVHFKKMTYAVWPYAMNIGIIAFYYRCSGLLLDRTTGVGEIVIAEGDQIEESQSADPACTSYNVSNLM